MEYLAVGWCRRKWLRLYETIRNLTSGEIGILLVVIRWEYQIEKDHDRVSPRPLRGKREEGTVRFSVLEHLWMIGLMVVMLISYSRAVSVVLVLLGVGPVLRRRYGVEWQKVCCIVSVKWDVSKVRHREFNISYRLMWDSQTYRVIVS